METPASFLRTALILKSDRIYADALRQTALAVLPGTEVRIAGTVEEAQRALREHPAELVLSGLGSTSAADRLDFLSWCATRGNRIKALMVIVSDGESREFAALRSLPIQGVFDAVTENPRQLPLALHTVGTGGRYWSPSVLLRMRQEYHGSIFRLLTPFEQIVLSIIGDGSDDAAAAQELELCPSTISTVRRHLHRKLGVQHRGELIRVAAQNGFVRFTPSGVFRPGFALLAARYRTRKRKLRSGPSDMAA
jgi:DNA-binding NarL/FixJ family response regulator